MGRGALSLVLAAAAVLAGCGSASPEGTLDAPSERPQASLSAAIAMADEVKSVDPLFARTRSEHLISRQIHEPLTAVLNPPFATTGRRRGPARPLGPSAGATLWEFELRPGVAFQDGSELNADAVLDNVERWQAAGAAAKLIPELVAADSPQPGRVRLQLDQPVEDLPERLDRGRLGLVSPLAIRARGTRPIRAGLTGTGAFELRERERGRLLLAQNADWWGREAGLGPGVERLEVLIEPADRERLAQLRAGAVQIGDELNAAAVRRLRNDPLLTSLEGGATAIGLERSVRGVETTRADQPLSGLWLTALRPEE
jgi:peptide/nickel transport system substrate-binding protein